MSNNDDKISKANTIIIQCMIKKYFVQQKPQLRAFNTIFRLHNIHLDSIPSNIYILCTEKPVLNANLKDFWFTNINYLIVFEKDEKYVLNG